MDYLEKLSDHHARNLFLVLNQIKTYAMYGLFKKQFNRSVAVLENRARRIKRQWEVITNLANEAAREKERADVWEAEARELRRLCDKKTVEMAGMEEEIQRLKSLPPGVRTLDSENEYIERCI